MTGSFIGVLTHLFPMLPYGLVLTGSFIGVLTHLFPMLPYGLAMTLPFLHPLFRVSVIGIEGNTGYALARLYRRRLDWRH